MPVRIDRLQQIIADLADVTEDQFDSIHWYRGSWRVGTADPLVMGHPQPLVWVPAVPTSACAIGWHCVKHPDAELKLISGIPTIPLPIGGFLLNLPAVALYLGISSLEVLDLFMGIGVPEEKAPMIERIELFIEQHKPALEPSAPPPHF